MPLSNHSLLQVQTRDRIKRRLFRSLGWKVIIFEDRYFSPETAFEVIRNVVGQAGNAPTSDSYELPASL